MTRVALLALVGIYLATVALLLASALFREPTYATPSWSWSTSFHA